MSSTHMLSFAGKQPCQAKSLVLFAGNNQSNTDSLSSKPSENVPDLNHAPKNTSSPVDNVSKSITSKALLAQKQLDTTLLHSAKDVAFKKAEWMVNNVYSRGPGIRYAFEQVGSYTLPRIIQQWTRSHSITGLFNNVAALEVGIREIASDFSDTLLPGLIAKGIGHSIDKRHQTLVSKNIGTNNLTFYGSLLQSKPGRYVNEAEFLERLQKRLNETARRHNPKHEFQDLELEHRIKRIIKDKTKIDDEVKNLVVKLGLTNSFLRIRHDHRTFQIRIPQLLNDLRDLYQAPRLRKADPFRPEWGKQLYTTIIQTQKKTPHQLWGLLVAGSVTLSIPFLIRLATRNYYNEDAFPGSKELTKALLDNKPSYFNSASESNSNSPVAAPHKPKKFEFFPYLTETKKQNNLLPTLGTLAFYSAILLMAKRRFSSQGLSMLNPKHWLKVYEFDRNSPISTLAQMELTYGLLCGTRLASSRDDSEYRETGVRDCLLGWPTLTYGFAALHHFLSKIANKRLEKEFGHPTLLVNDLGVLRSAASIGKHYFDNLGLGERTDEAMKKTHRAYVWVTMASAAINWTLLAILEPQISIWVTNKLELDKIKKEKEVLSSQNQGNDTSDSSQQNFVPMQHSPF
jgi:hypothetical protein